jgi:hypothetical protein
MKEKMCGSYLVEEFAGAERPVAVEVSGGAADRLL